MPETEVETNKGFRKDIDSVSSIGATDTIEFVSTANSDVYTNLASSYLQVLAKIPGGDGSDLNADAKVGPVNAWMHVLFSQMEVYLNNKLVIPPQAQLIPIEHTSKLF